VSRTKFNAVEIFLYCSLPACRKIVGKFAGPTIQHALAAGAGEDHQLFAFKPICLDCRVAEKELQKARWRPVDEEEEPLRLSQEET
jgi:hypothetical protein